MVSNYGAPAPFSRRVGDVNPLKSTKEGDQDWRVCVVLAKINK